MDVDPRDRCKQPSRNSIDGGMLSTIDVFVRGEWLWIKYNQVSKSQGFQAGGPRGRGGKRKRPLGLEKKRSTDPFNQDAGINNPGKLRSSTDQVQLKLSS